ncbi:MAG: amino acid permease [Verrucomicrobia bacterium]|nr:MAG: amino acid permease [Verrucomicrobiota bacterium]
MNSQPAPGDSQRPHLLRRFGLLQATALNMTNMIGIGPFITIPALMSALNGPRAMLGWLVAVLITIPDALVWSELGAAMPGSGGSYVYLRDGFGRETFGRLMAFLFVWQFILSGPLEIASGYIGFAQYLNYLWPGVTTEHGLSLAGSVIVIGLGIFCIALLYRRITSIGKITVSLWIGTLLTTGAVILTGALHFNPKLAFDFPPEEFKFSLGFLFGLGAATRIGVYDYLGYYDVCFIGDEVRDPGKVIPRSILISIVGVALIYVAINFSIIGVVPWREFVPATDPPAPVVSLLMEKIYGSKVAAVFTLMVLWTAFGSVFALLLGYSRIPYAAAQDGYFFKIFARLHPSKNFPHVSLIVIGVVSIVCSFLSLQTVIDALLVTRILVQFIGQIFAVMLLRERAPGMQRPYRIHLYPLPPLIALAGWLFLFGSAETSLKNYGALALSLGVALFFVWSWRTRRWPFVFASKEVAAGTKPSD